MRPMGISAKDKRLLAQIQGDIPICASPFGAVARKAGWNEEEVLRRVRFFIRRGTIRRFGAILRHQRAGYLGNAMAVWRVPEGKVTKVSRAMVACKSVSHCYLRPAHPGWPYNLYTMLHGENERDCRKIARSISRQTGVSDFRLLFSRREHKKSSMDYFG